MTGSESLGYARMIDAIKVGEDLPDVLLGLMGNAKGNPALNQALFIGGMECILATYLALSKAGFKFKAKEPSLQPFVDGNRARIVCDLLQSSSAGNDGLFRQQLEALASAITQTSSKISFSMPAPLPVVAIVPKPIDIRLVAMPDRVTTTDFVRDSSTLEIVTSSTREIDAAAQVR